MWTISRRGGGPALIVLVATLNVLAVQSLIHSPPRIIKQPPTDEMLFQVAQPGENDKPFIVECEAEGEPTPRYRWIKNGKKFEWQTYDDRMSQQPGRGTLVIKSPRDEDLGQYQCFAENEHGTATSNSVFVRKAELNSFKDETAKTVQVDEGSPFKMQCQPPDGWPRPNVYWLIQNMDGGISSINNSRMTLDPEGNLWFSNVTRDDQSDDFYYACAASSLFRNEYKIGNRVLLQVKQTGISAAQNKHHPQRQYVSRKNEVALRGKKIEMYCIYGGTPLPQVVWTKDGRPIQWNDKIQQNNYGKSLVIRHATFEDQGTYQCESSNGVGSAESYSIRLEVQAVPYFTVEPEIVNAAEDETAEFRCEATGVPKPKIIWVHNGKPIDQSPNNPRRIVTTNKIYFTKLEKGDTGNYGCNATNSLGYVYKDVYLNVLALAPEITEPPKLEYTVDRRNVTMTCRVFGAPKPEVKWIRNGRELTGGRYQILETGDLFIRGVEFSDAGEYTCNAINKLGEKSASGELVVKEHTKIIDEPQDYEVVAGTQATFRCNAVADSSLGLTIEWLTDGVPIDFETQPRFVMTNDYSLTISKTIELDTGVYTCLARTDLDEVNANATLTVYDRPNSPSLVGIECHQAVATITWKPNGDNRSPILHYTIEFNTSFTPDSWEISTKDVPATDFTYSVDMSPWANYTFRVIAINKVGPSLPSGHSDICTTQPSVPFKNPDNVEGQGTEPNNLLIKWTPMSEIEHNAPRFQYRVYWQLDTGVDNWNTEDIFDWQQSALLVRDQPTFQRYRIKVVAINELGEANVAPKEVIGYSGEDKPLEPPTNFTLIQVTAPTSAILSWNPVTEESVRGHFKGYKIQTWTDTDGEENLREVLVTADSKQALVTDFVPDSTNYARILAYNGRFNGPASTTLSFDTPEGVPNTIQSLDAIPLGSSAFLLKWKKPLQTNGKLTGYKIYYEEVKGTSFGPRMEREPHIHDPRITDAKLGKLKQGTKYRVHVVGTTKAGEGQDYYIEQKTASGISIPPDQPYFAWERQPNDNGRADIKVIWQPNLEGKPGSHFFVKYRIKGENQWLMTEPVLYENHHTVHGLDPDSNYEFRVVSVDGEYQTESLSQEVDTYGIEGPIKVPNENVATAGWFIGMMLAIAFLILLLIIICIVKRNRGGKYDVHDRELANGRNDYTEEGGFPEYSQPVLRDYSLDNKSQGRQSLSSQKVAPESDTDSMAEYGEGDTGGQFTEDGSFIGQYVPGKPPVSAQSTPQNPSLQGANAGMATYV
ncbi:neuroglian isoform X1 [Topomyia yanbarensis]|uniref:neuroglian isoform X1 n=1 Tax=Topomyia yanbarensis TaxID=2498891 RepID=UPI00273CF0DC|nr:neuroglian isoform X1 [Topomyia yanbarensis]XP_058814204.1 neuroglian isoform X1 [Topomyia yanbarensis]XP_058814207.1 neuroglian isoform X1 [Topomyia yanbarensis]XP_058814214.1 neuroglian isoform X1 [Topomyia yanbarensis]XP_058814223.1 neuroglian isoform X1 [Topomyia yanbarensis]XP_058814230.1 neuroglian isoform X1 [Topomyia yanbarensis]XP_058814241.1 neuroglian isoform X1 [Topomyia yanbarensis]XP_058814250.1 neuroglian isoform X1 [Topomyia yanbarensis]XP_058814257.1 neuroglian isoform X